MRRKHRHRDEEAQINITPMLDIVFIMLIFFIVTTSFVKEVAVEASRPSSQPREAKMSEVIAVRIDQNGQISVDERIVDVRAVRANIETRLAAKPDASVVIISHREADAGVIVRVIDQARVAGATRVSLAAPAG